MKNLNEILAESVNNSNAARIFIIIKPGFFNIAQDILNKFKEAGYIIEKQTSKKLLLKEAKQLYKIHKDEDWYNDLCDYMSSDITTAFILINKNKKMSPQIFKEINLIKDEIRNEYGESDMRNVIHSSDSINHMKQEQSIYFAI